MSPCKVWKNNLPRENCPMKNPTSVASYLTRFKARALLWFEKEGNNCPNMSAPILRNPVKADIKSITNQSQWNDWHWGRKILLEWRFFWKYCFWTFWGLYSNLRIRIACVSILEICLKIFDSAQSTGDAHYLGYCIKQIDSILPWVCTLITHRGRQNMERTSVYLPEARSLLLCSYHVLADWHHLYAKLRYQGTDARQNGIFS